MKQKFKIGQRVIFTSEGSTKKGTIIGVKKGILGYKYVIECCNAWNGIIIIPQRSIIEIN